MIVHGLFAEVLNRAPSLILSNVNYVKKGRVSVGDTAGHCHGRNVVPQPHQPWYAAGHHCTLQRLPALDSHFCPAGPATLGHLYPWSGLDAGILGRVLRDVGQTISIFTMVMLFLFPVFYPVTALPEEFRPWLMANPLTFIIEQAREVLIWGHLPNCRV